MKRESAVCRIIATFVKEVNVMASYFEAIFRASSYLVVIPQILQTYGIVSPSQWNPQIATRFIGKYSPN